MLRCLYVDLDATLLGRGGSLLRDGNGDFTLLGARALEACHRAGVEVCIFSGRRRVSLAQDSRILGISTYIFEAGAGLLVDGEIEWLTGDLQPTATTTVHDLITASGAPALLMEHYDGCLEYHTPWDAEREVSHLFRGRVDAAEADALLAGHGLGNLRLVDNGGITKPPGALPGIDRPRGYHLVPEVVSKARGVARHMQVRGYAREEVIAVGDSREDIGAAEVVGTFWLVANALRRDPTLQDLIPTFANVRIAEEANGAGVHEAVMTTLAEAR
jgi:hydroxymethylpyrimidine pyrophosphatase-like HAD family hydrolase